MNIEVNNDIQYDLFISHYQKTGGPLALLIKNYLTEKQKLDIFLDVDDMNSVHNLEKNIEISENVLLLITDGVFDRPFVQLELKKALECNKNIILLWDKMNCEFPKKKDIPDFLLPILDIKAITWLGEKYLRSAILKEINNNIKIKTDKEKFLDLINKKDNYKQIFSSLCIKEYLKKIYNYDIISNQISNLSQFNFTPIFEIKTISEIKNYSLNIVFLAIFNICSISEIIQKRTNKIIMYGRSDNDNFDTLKFNIKENNEKIILTISLGVYDVYEEYSLKFSVLKHIISEILKECEKLLF